MFDVRSCVSGIFFCLTMVMVTIALVMAVIVTNIYGRVQSNKVCAPWVVQIASRIYDSHEDRRRRTGRKSTPLDACAMLGNGDVSCEASPIGDVYSGTSDEDVRDRNRNSRSRHAPRSRSKAYKTASPAVRLPSRDEQTIIGAEWLLVARAADRVFFWLFFVLSCLFQTYVFVSICHYQWGSAATD